MLLKRGLDVAVSAAALLMLSPVLIAIALLVLVRDGRPVLFSQRRSGLMGRTFRLQKFRTMSTESEDPTTDGMRITRLGAKLRTTSLDELPTFVNVLRGDMSLVGPRPLPERYLDRYDDTQRRRLEVRPGVTGLAQVRGRNLLSWEERFALDVEYVDNHSLVGDVRLLVETVKSVVRRDGIEADDSVTMAEFWGTNIDGPPKDEVDRG